MCDLPVPCKCTLEERAKRRAEHIARSDALGAMYHRLWRAGQITEVEAEILRIQAEQEWDDAIHVASPDDPLRSLCGHYGRNLVDLPEKPDPWAGCWTCLEKAEALEPQSRELVHVE